MNFESLGVTGWARVWLPRLQILGVHRYRPQRMPDRQLDKHQKDRRSPRLNFDRGAQAVRMTCSFLRCGSAAVHGGCQLGAESCIVLVALLLTTAFLRYACNVTQPLKSIWTKVQTHAPTTLNSQRIQAQVPFRLTGPWTLDSTGSSVLTISLADFFRTHGTVGTRHLSPGCDQQRGQAYGVWNMQIAFHHPHGAVADRHFTVAPRTA